MVQPLFTAGGSPPDPLDPSWGLVGPDLRRVMARRLNEYILGKPDNNSTATPFLDPLFSGATLTGPGIPAVPGLAEYIKVVGAMAQVDAKQPVATIVDPDALISHSILNPKLMDLLYGLVDMVVNSELADGVKLLSAAQKLVQFYITPHVLLPDSNQELPMGQTSNLVVEPLKETLPVILLPAIRKKLHSLWYHLDNSYESANDNIDYIELRYHIDNNQTYTRCPELFPLHALLNGNSGGAGGTKRPLATTQGIRINTRPLGQAILSGVFKDAFSAENLDKASFQTVGTGANETKVTDPVVALRWSRLRRGLTWSRIPLAFTLPNPITIQLVPLLSLASGAIALSVPSSLQKREGSLHLLAADAQVPIAESVMNSAAFEPFQKSAKVLASESDAPSRRAEQEPDPSRPATTPEYVFVLQCTENGFRGDCLVFGAAPGKCVSYFDFDPANSTEISQGYNDKIVSLSTNTGGSCQFYKYAIPRSPPLKPRSAALLLSEVQCELTQGSVCVIRYKGCNSKGDDRGLTSSYNYDLSVALPSDPRTVEYNKEITSWRC
ncbi:hypothetical protein PG993_014200 [Apiospora rasikravindrae]|uniref:Uncharacterized protein n=1 Tax=Apiospora rasikravindrae TaxID=990691 RepID=A0ABR1RSD6_9PEZI